MFYFKDSFKLSYYNEYKYYLRFNAEDVVERRKYFIFPPTIIIGFH